MQTAFAKSKILIFFFARNKHNILSPPAQKGKKIEDTEL